MLKLDNSPNYERAIKIINGSPWLELSDVAEIIGVNPRNLTMQFNRRGLTFNTYKNSIIYERLK